MHRQPNTTLQNSIQNWQDKTPKASPDEQFIMEYPPGLPQDTKSLRSCSGDRAKMLHNCGAGSLLIPEDNKKNSLNDCIVNNKLILINGRHLELALKSQQQQAIENQMPVTQGYVGEHKVTALRDKGCSSVIVKEKFVKQEQYIGKHGYMIMADNTA